MLEGDVRHRDSLGNNGTIGPGDVQWMTAGGGILHEEMPQRGEKGVIYGFQLWVNLPSRLKMTSPRYQEVLANTIPFTEDQHSKVRVVTGKVGGISGPVTDVAVEPLYLEVQLSPNAAYSQPVESDQRVLAYVFSGEGSFADTLVSSVQMVVFSEGDTVEVKTVSEPLRFMLIAGTPIGEPIAPYGPFVMNTREEIQQALDDLRNGTFVKN
jgi:hypothetical protein